MKVYRVRNWSSYQHVKTRNAPWIKVYSNLLNDLEWHSLPPESAKILINCWLIGSENFGILPSLKKLAFRLRIAEGEAKDQLDLLTHWIVNEEVDISEVKKKVDYKPMTRRYQDDNNVITTCHQDDNNMYIEIEREKETERDMDIERIQRDLTTDKSYPQVDGLKRPHQLSGWKLSKEDKEFLITQRPDLNLEQTTREFCSYWATRPKFKGAPKNWSYQWQKWVMDSFVKDKNSADATVQVNADIARTKAREAADDAIIRNGPSLETLEIIAKIKGKRK
jgi:hypothetical protein